MPEYQFLVVFVAGSARVTWWTRAYSSMEADWICEDAPYHEPELGMGYVLTECSEHGWRPTEEGICRDCYDIYCEFEWRQDPSYDPIPDEYEEEL